MDRSQIELLIIAAPIFAGLYKYILKPAAIGSHQAVKNLAAIETIQTGMAQVHKAVHELQQDMRPNGGSSLRDAIDRVEKIVQVNQNTMKAILDLLNAGFFVTDTIGEYTHVNLHWQSLTGIDAGDALGHGWVLAVHPEDRKGTLEEWELAVADERPFHKKFRIVNHKTKVVVEVYCHTTTLRDAEGTVVGFIGSLTEA